MSVMRNKRILEIGLFVFVIGIFLLQLYFKRNRFTLPYNYDYFADKYLHSQYVEGEGSKYTIPDYELYSYAGYYYITGGEISRVNFENPPLGKYLIGLSIILFGNPLVIYLAFSVIYLTITYKFGRLIFQERIIALLALVILVSDPYFIHQASYTHLDFPMATFFLVGFYLFLTTTEWKRYAVAAIFFGLAIASKFFPFFAVILIYLGAIAAKKGRRALLSFSATIPVIVAVYVLTFQNFLLRQGILEFLRYQWWVLRWRMGNPIVVGNILQAVFFGRLGTWWGSAVKFHYYPEEWSPLLPTVIVLTLLSPIFYRRSLIYRIIYGYILLFLGYIFFITEGGLKYLAPIYPFFSLFSSAVLFQLSRLIIRRLSLV